MIQKRLRFDENGTMPRSASLSRQFAQWVTALRYEDLPAAVIDRAKGVTLHALSSALLGAASPATRQAIELVSEEESGVRKGARVMVTGDRVTRAGAAFVNAEMTLAGGKWDTFQMLLHPGVSVIPAALAMAQNAPVTGRDFITAVAAGYELSERLARDFIPAVMARGFHASPVFGIFGAAVAAARILRLSEHRVQDTIGLCASLAGGNVESRALREGIAARNALFAVSLAQQGRPSAETTLEGRAGFYHAYAGSNAGLDQITDDLGTGWIFLDTIYRIYSIPGYNQAHIDLTASLCEEHSIQPEDVDRIEAVVNSFETQFPSPVFPHTSYYTACAVLRRGFPLLNAPKDLPEALELMKRVTIVASPDMTLFGPRITIFTKDGRSCTKQGSGREFIWDFEEEARRIRDVVPVLPIPAAQFEEIVTTCRDLERAERADQLVQLTLKR
jgi:2-methylcitrate dehydratase PrpD